jgi:hypothetical protein
MVWSWSASGYPKTHEGFVMIPSCDSVEDENRSYTLQHFLSTRCSGDGIQA